MPFLDPPPLPDFLTPHLPFSRRAYALERGIDAGHSLHFLDAGPRDAPPLFLLHGNPTWSFLWRKVIAGLPGFRCVAPDLLGLGLSSKLPRLSDHTLERHTEALVELILALDLREMVLVGQDWGGPLATLVGQRLPERVVGLVFGNTVVAFPRVPRGAAFHRFARMPWISDLAFRLLNVPQGYLWATQGDRRSISGDVARAYRWPLRHIRDRVAPLALARLVPTGREHPSFARLDSGARWAQAFEGPVAFVWGLKDPILGRALGRHERAFPQASFVRTVAGHFLQEEVPEKLVEAIEGVADASRRTGPAASGRGLPRVPVPTGGDPALGCNEGVEGGTA